MEPIDILRRAALERCRPMVDELRRAGWDVQVVLSAPTASKVVLALEIHLAMERVPCEYANAQDPRPGRDQDTRTEAEHG